MRRIDVLAIALAVFFTGGGLYLLFEKIGFDSLNAGVWSQVVLVIGLIGWVLTYVLRAATQNMSYNQQIKDYEEAVMLKRWEEMSPEEREKLMEETAANPEAKKPPL